MVQVLRPQAPPLVAVTPPGLTFHGRVLYPPGEWGRRRPVFPATVEVNRGSHVMPLWDTAETTIDGSFSTTRGLASGTPDVFLKIRDAITTDRFEIDIGPSAAPASGRPRLPSGAATNPVEPAEIVVPWKLQKQPTLGCLDGRYFANIHDLARTLCTHLRRRTLPTTVGALWIATRPDDSSFSRAEIVLRGLARSGLPADFPRRLAKTPGLRTYTEGMTETAIAILGRIAAASSNQRGRQHLAPSAAERCRGGAGHLRRLGQAVSIGPVRGHGGHVRPALRGRTHGGRGQGKRQDRDVRSGFPAGMAFPYRRLRLQPLTLWPARS